MGIFDDLRDDFHKKFGGELIIIDAKNFDRYRDAILKLQEQTYEKVRQTSIVQFQKAAENLNGLCLGLIVKGNLVGITFAAPLALFPHECGVKDDPHFCDPKVLYALDSTVVKDFQGLGIGRLLKYAQALLAKERGIESICGRVRDRLAQGMLKINLSLGSYERSYIPRYYCDEEKYRDSIYYTYALKWSRPPLNLSKRVTSPCEEIEENFIEEQLPSLINKVCLSNFVGERFLTLLKSISELLPAQLRHVYTSSGQSECVDKIAKCLWHNNKKTNRIISFQDHFFGNGTFLSRSLNGTEDFFPVDILPHPHFKNESEVLKEVEKCLSGQSYAGVWIEPITQLGFKVVPSKFLVKLRKLCSEKKVPLIYNETASSGLAWDKKHYFVSSDSTLAPDAGFAFLGGQAGIVFCSQDIWVADKLMMISTWDGDEFSFANYHSSMQKILNNRDDYEATIGNFEKKLKDTLKNYPIEEMSFHRGRGRFKGIIPTNLKRYFDDWDGYYLVNPSFDSMKRFLEA